MERVITPEERMRRAEEIYNRRRVQNRVRVSSSNVNTGNKKYKLYKKLILQIAICFVIYFIFYLIKNSGYFFSESFISKTKEFLSYDINFQNVYNSVSEFYNNNMKSFFMPITDKTVNEKNDSTNEITNELVNQIITDNTNESITNSINDANVETPNAGIGGGEDNSINIAEQVKQTSTQAVVQLSQMEIDANEVKKNYNLILPVAGIVSSRYGPRQGNSIVSSNHAGIDIAANEGTVFVAAMSGTCILASFEGSYGKHLFIKEGDVTTVYAHCSKLYVKEGDKIQQGQKLGEVGQTGNATGPHLHFEIRRQDRTINPELILSFG